MPRMRTVAIGTDAYRADCPVPRAGIGFWEGLALSWRGRLDARRNRDVPDVAHTHSLHRLQAFCRRSEAEAVRRIDEALSAVDRDLAVREAERDEPLPEVPPLPTSAELAGLADADRGRWASRVRDAQAAAARSVSAAERRARATSEIAVLRSVRAALSVEGEDVRHQWREAFAMRAARYTRARFSGRGAAVATEPLVAAYHPTEGPTVQRDRA